MNDPGAVARYEWAEKIPLPEQWARNPKPVTLAFWIAKSESCEWTFDQLGDLVGVMIDSGEAVPVLDRWARQVAARRLKRPTRPGPKGDRTRDFRIAALVGILSRYGISERQAKQAISEALHKTESAMHDALCRGRSV